MPPRMPRQTTERAAQAMLAAWSAMDTCLQVGKWGDGDHTVKVWEGAHLSPATSGIDLAGCYVFRCKGGQINALL